MLGTSEGLLSYLEDEDDSSKIHGLTELVRIVGEEWAQIADRISMIQDLANNEQFSGHEIAASLASRTLYYTGNLRESVDYALKANDCFDIHKTDPYSKTLISQTIFAYSSYVNTHQTPPEKLTKVVQQILDGFLKDQKYDEALALGIECRSLTHIKSALEGSPKLVSGAVRITNRSVDDIDYRNALLKLFVDFATNNCDKFMLTQILLSLDDHEQTSKVIIDLKQSSSSDNWLLAYQIAFELAENASQKFRSNIIKALPEEMSDIKDILKRKKLIELYFNFLYTNRDTKLIETIQGLRDGTDEKAKLVKSSIQLAYSLIYASTGDDSYYRDQKNNEWFRPANNDDWSKFTSIAGLGAIHSGRFDEASIFFEPYFRKDSTQYGTGGALFAYGLILANYTWNDDIIHTITNLLQTTQSAVIKHGGCFGLGLIAMGSQNQDYYTIIRQILNDKNQADPVAGEAAGYALGLIMLGSGNAAIINDLFDVAKNTRHEKIARSVSFGIAFMMYGLEDKSIEIVDKLLSEREPILRESAAWVTALAYVGTSSNTGLQKLLHISTSDVNDNVRRAATIGLGFILSRDPQRLPSIIKLLAQSYNPAVRNGAALATAIAFSGSGNNEAIEIIKPLLKDEDPFVVQSAMISMALILQEQSDTAVPYCKEFREFLRKKITKNTARSIAVSRQEVVQWGVSIAYGILNAGGRNVIVSCNNLNGENSMPATVGLAMFCNYFYWHPLTLMITLAYHPTAIIGLDESLQVVDWTFFCWKQQSYFDNPPSFDQEAPVVKIDEARKLTVTKNSDRKAEEEAKVAAQEAAKTENNGEKKEEASKAEEPAAKEDSSAENAPLQKTESGDDQDVDFFQCPNNTRVTPNQFKNLQFDADFNYIPVTGKVLHNGIVMLKTAPKD